MPLPVSAKTIRLPSMLPPDQILLVKAALWPAQEALTYWQAWKQYHRIDEASLLNDVDLLPKVFDPLDYGSQLLMAQVYYNLQYTADKLVPRLRGFYRYSWLKNESAWQAFLPVVDSLQEKRIAPIWLQGSSWAEQDSRRLPQDVTVCLPIQDQKRVLSDLRKQGWEIPAHQTRWDPMVSLKDSQKHIIRFQRTLLPFPISNEVEQFLWQQTEPVCLSATSQLPALLPTYRVFCGLVWSFWQRTTPELGLIAECVAIVRQSTIDWAEVFRMAQPGNASYAISEGVKLLTTDFGIVLTEEENTLLRALVIDQSQRDYHQFLRQQRLPLDLRQSFLKIRLMHKAYYQQSPFGFWFLRKTAFWSIRQLRKLGPTRHK